MNRILLIGLAAAAFLAGGCSSTFLVSKDGQGYFLESNAKSLQRMLCDSGDLRQVLSVTHLKQGMKDEFFRYNCTEERSGQKIKEIFAVMTPVERKELRLAFKSNGYDINYLPC